MSILNENMPLVIAVASFLGVLCIYVVVASLVASRRRESEIVARARKLSGRMAGDNSKKDKQPGDDQLRRLFRFSGAGNEGGIYANTPLFYQRAGIYNKASIRFYQVLRFVLLFAPVVGGLLLHYGDKRPITSLGLLLICGLCLVGYLGPVMWLRFKAGRRKKELSRTFPDAMDLLMVCVEAGMGIDSAISRVSKEIHITSPELAKEFKILTLELKTGRPRNDCLKSLAQRTDLTDVENLVSLLIQAERYGTGVANALKVHAEEMRQRRYSRLEELAAKLPVKLTIPMMLFIFPALFVVIGGPAVIQVLHIILKK